MHSVCLYAVLIHLVQPPLRPAELVGAAIKQAKQTSHCSRWNFKVTDVIDKR